jgi:Xaa-Pro dipeptidase
MTTQRLTKIIELMKQNKLDTIALNPGPSLFYLTGLHFHLMERPVVLFIDSNTHPTIVLPELEILKVKQSSIPLEAITYGDDPSSWNSAFKKALEKIRPQLKVIGIEPTQFRFLEMDFIRKAAIGIEFICTCIDEGHQGCHRDRKYPKSGKDCRSSTISNLTANQNWKNRT